GIRDFHVTGVQTCALPISRRRKRVAPGASALEGDRPWPVRCPANRAGRSTPSERRCAWGGLQAFAPNLTREASALAETRATAAITPRPPGTSREPPASARPHPPPAGPLRPSLGPADGPDAPIPKAEAKRGSAPEPPSRRAPRFSAMQHQSRRMPLLFRGLPPRPPPELQRMGLDHVSTGKNPPDEINVIIEI